jgi:hypothetical protein
MISRLCHVEMNFPHSLIELCKLCFLLCLVISISLTGSNLGFGQDDAIEEGQQALESLGSTPWYDSSSDGYRIPTSLQDDEAAGRKSKWLGKKQQWNFPQGNTGVSLSWWGWFLSIFSPVFFYGVFPALIIVVLLIALQSVLPESYRFIGRPSKKSDKNTIDAERISDLPFSVDMQQTDPLAEVRRCLEKGDFERAIIYLFAYQLLQLDSHKAIILQRGKTNRVYLRELRQRPDLRRIVENTMLAFEQVFFGRYRLSQERFMENWNRLDDFHMLLKQSSQESTAPLGLGAAT